MTPRPFAVHHSGFARDSLLAAFVAATTAGRGAEAITAARVIERGLQWYADGFGESRRPLQLLGQLRWACILPISVWFAVMSRGGRSTSAAIGSFRAVFRRENRS